MQTKKQRRNRPATQRGLLTWDTSDEWIASDLGEFTTQYLHLDDHTGGERQDHTAWANDPHDPLWDR